MTTTTTILTDDQQTELETMLQRTWFGTKENISFTLKEGVILNVFHDVTDDITLCLSFMDNTYLPEEIPDRLSELGNDFLKLTATIGTICGSAFNSSKRVTFYRNSGIGPYEAQYTCTLNPREFASITSTV